MVGRLDEAAGREGQALLHLAARYGFRRIERVTLRVGQGRSAASVTGVAHRYPRSVRVPLRVAHALVAAGARLTVEQADPPRPPVLV